MYHIYLDEEIVNAFAKRLASSKPFADGTYTLYADVPVKCLKYESPYFTSLTNLKTMDEGTATQTVDFIITKGTDVMLGITTEVMAKKSRKLFETVLHPIPYIEVPFSGHIPQKYKHLYHKVRDYLESLEENPCPCFSLNPFPVGLAEEELKNKHFLNPNGNVNAYGRDLGLFFRYSVSTDGALERHPVCAVTFHEYLTALNYQRSVPEDGNLTALQTLLDVSIGELFCHHSKEWNELNDVMAELAKLKSYPVGAPEDILEDYPELVYQLRCRVADGNPENQQIMALTEKLLICISEVLEDEQSAERFEVLRMPLHRYYEEAAQRSGLYYPKWLYQHAVSPYLNSKFRKTHTLQDLLKYRSYLPAGTPFPGLMELLVLPLFTHA